MIFAIVIGFNYPTCSSNKFKLNYIWKCRIFQYTLPVNRIEINCVDVQAFFNQNL